jgi:hypothetical protein
MASKINSNLYREAPSSFFIPPKHNDPCNEVQNKNYKQKKKDQKMQVVSLHPNEEREREREREQHAIILPSDPLLGIQPRISHGDSCLKAYKTFIIQ